MLSVILRLLWPCEGGCALRRSGCDRCALACLRGAILVGCGFGVALGACGSGLHKNGTLRVTLVVRRHFGSSVLQLDVELEFLPHQAVRVLCVLP